MQTKYIFCRAECRLPLPKGGLYSGKYRSWKKTTCHVTAEKQFNASSPCDNMAKRVNSVFEYTCRRIVSSSMEEHIPVSHTMINYARCFMATVFKKNLLTNWSPFSQLGKYPCKGCCLQYRQRWLACSLCIPKDEKNPPTKKNQPKTKTARLQWLTAKMNAGRIKY